MAITKINFTWVDHSGEYTTTSLNVDTIAEDGNNYGDVISDPLSNMGTMQTALAAVTKLNRVKSAFTVVRDLNVENLPAAGADRELAARMTYQDVVTMKKYRFDIPGPIDGIFVANSDEVDMTSIAMAAFKLAFDANVQSEDGNGVSLLYGHKVGRRS